VGLSVSVSERDLRHIATLARLGLAPERVPALLAELNGILAHMDVLSQVDTSNVDPVLGVGAGGMRLRADDGPQYPLAHDRESFAPQMRDGFFLVPRLATHADARQRTEGEEDEA
jgi:aspartyl-tRNA(Asn)/glutamyl-tRNA(Gln) amidotransferase subunit C